MIAVYKSPVEQQEMGGTFEQHGVARMASLLAQFDPISLTEMKHVTLLNRTDTKYIMRSSQLYAALQQITTQYRVLDINHRRLNHYQTLYFDTPDFMLYQQHHNGLRSRYKVRVREYVDSDLTYWEVKRKTNQERTIKTRLQTRHAATDSDGQIDDFIDTHAPLDAQAFEPKLWNKFLRITLVSKQHPERLTLDLNMEFGWGDACTALPGIAVAEVKQERASQPSDFVQQMRRMGIRPNPFSKYCAGICMLYDSVKTNNFKARMRLVNKLMQEEMAHEYVR